jgi:hypothetical protein
MTYETPDTQFAAYLKAAGMAALAPEWRGRRLYYLFEDGPDYDRMGRDYYDYRGPVDARTYYNALQWCRDYLYTENK